MTYTTQQLQAMSDFEVNTALFEKLMPKSCFSYEADKRIDAGSVFWNTENDDHEVDYCNNPNDIMQLAFERKVSIEYCHYGKWWGASAWKQTGKNEDTMIANFSDKENPLRAIACLLLMMED